MQGKVIGGRYKIIERLGGGAFGQTYRAEDTQLPGNPHCVVKQLKPQNTDPSTLETAKRLFSSEAQVLHQLGNHEQIPRLYAYFEEEEEFYLVQELIEGVPLSEEILPGKPWGEAEVINLLEQILSVLDFVHQQNTIHRDIKPSNLMRRRDGKFIAIDFGAVKQISSQVVTPSGNSKLTVAVSTFGYTPPEQLQGHPRCSSDIYALGMTAIQAITGIVPHKLPRDPKTDLILWRPYAVLSDRLAAILEKMVDYRLAERYQSAQEVLDDLQKLTQSSTGSIAPANATTVFTGGNKAYPTPLTNVSQTSVQPNSTVYQNPATTQFSGPASGGSPKKTKSKSFKPWYLLAILPGIVLLLGIIELVFPIFRPIYYLGKGRELMEMDRHQEALEKFERVTDIKANSVEAWNGIGDAYRHLGREERAMEAYDRALRIVPGNVETLNDKARLLYDEDKDKEALESYEKAITNEPNNADSWYGKGIALIGLGRYEEAIEAFDKAREYAPEKPAVWYSKALALQALGREQEAINVYNEAIATYDDILRKNSKDIRAYVDRGAVLHKLGRFEDALASYDKALDINPNFYQALLQKSNVLISMKRFNEALEAAEIAVQIRGKNYLAWHNRGTLLAIGMATKQNNTEAQRKEYLEMAVKSYDEATKLRETFHDAWRDRGAALAQLGRTEEAIESFNRALQIKSDDYKSWTSKGITLNSAGRNREALAAFDKAIDINENDFFVWFYRGLALEQLGEKQEAIKSYDRSIEIKPDFQPAIDKLQKLRAR
jgi:tetratricopeptide (TPR) repeat protein